MSENNDRYSSEESKFFHIAISAGVAVLDIRAEDVENILFAKCKRLVIFVIDAIFPVLELMVDSH